MKHMQMILVILLTAALALPTNAVLADVDALGPLTSTLTVAPNPATVNTTITITAAVDDSTTGGSNILSAEFSVNAGAWTPMSAVDGAFDSVTENATATFTLTQAGSNVVCVRGTDVLNNIGDAVCSALTGQYQYIFTGFSRPIRMSVLNNVKAGRTIPVKWRLTLPDGTPVTDPASFVALKSYAIDCTTLVGDVSTAVVEPTTGKPHLNKLGKGKWLFTWKISKTYSHTCRAMFALFSDGQSSPSVLFRFR